MATYSTISNGDSGLVARNAINAIITDINNGTIGATGSNGSSGSSGSSGNSGTSGTSGSSGSSGNSGTSGSSGSSGNSGTSGSSGSSGSSAFVTDFFEVYITPNGTTASILSTTSSWSNNLLGPTGISGTLAGQRHYDSLYTYEAVLDNVWLRNNIGLPKRPQTLANAATITWNLSAGFNAEIGLTGDSGISITGATAGDYGTLEIVHTNANTRINFGSGNRFAAGTYSFTAATNSVDIYCFYFDGTNYHWNYNLDFK